MSSKRASDTEAAVNEKTQDTSSIDEDSGHDSVDDAAVQTPTDERERITHLETAVAWIRKEVVSLNGCIREYRLSLPYSDSSHDNL